VPDAEQWDRVNDLFQRTVGRPEAEQIRVLEEECGHLPAVRSQVESLLRADRAAERFLASTRAMAAELAARIRLHTPAGGSGGPPGGTGPLEGAPPRPDLDTRPGESGVGES
jgi:hypothetical protein